MNNVLFDTNIYLYHYRKYPPVVDAINAELNRVIFQLYIVSSMLLKGLLGKQQKFEGYGKLAPGKI